jgi:hypothetical protein
MVEGLAVVFTVIEALAAFWLAAVARHGPSGLGLAASAYLAVAAALTWAAAVSFRSRPRRLRVAIVLGTGLSMLALAPALLLALDRFETHRRAKRIAATLVSDVRDEPILSPAGEEVGVRLSFTLRVPSAGWYGVWPWLRSAQPGEEDLFLLAIGGRVEGRPYRGRLEAGRQSLEFELYPAAVVGSGGRGEPCVSPAPAPRPLPSAPASPLRVEIAETSYGSPWNGGREEVTRHAYRLGDMYRAVAAGGLPRCSDEPRGQPPEDRGRGAR